MAKITDGMNPADFKDRLAIDRSDLESCLEDHPELVTEVGEIQVGLIAVRDGLKLDLDELEAKLGDQYRSDAANSGEKATEKSIANDIVNDKAMQTLQRQYLKAKADVEAWNPIREAVHQRGYALRALVDIELKKLGVEYETAATGRKATELRHKHGEIEGSKARAGVVQRRRSA